MKKNHYFIIISLLISFFIYLFYRTEKTVITEIFISAISLDNYVELRNLITGTITLNDHVIYSLPEGLWVFCITLTSKNLVLRIANQEIDCVFIPLIFSIGLELFQLFHLTNGRFDFWDIDMSIFFWCVANYAINHQPEKQNILQPVNVKSSLCFMSYAIVYLAHVWQ